MPAAAAFLVATVDVGHAGSTPPWCVFPGAPHSVASLGDLDGDGAFELLLGHACRTEESGSLCCAAVVSMRDVRPRWRYDGGPALPTFGTAVAPWCDRDGDGVLDFAIGAPGLRATELGASSSSARSPGYVFVYSGRTGAPIGTLAGLSGGDGFGFDLVGGKDLDGDGRAELVVGAPGAGRVCVFSGATGKCAWHATETREAVNFGAAVDVVDDRDGDRLLDLVVGAPARMGGTAWIVSLRQGGHRTHLATDAITPGKDAAMWFGSAVAGLRDVDGNPGDEYAVGAAVTAVGARGWTTVFDGELGVRLARLRPQSRKADATVAMTAPGDLDGDAIDDLVVSKYEIWPSHWELPGATGFAFLEARSGLTGALLWRTPLDEDGPEVGGAIAPAGDVDRDGTVDLVLEADIGCSGSAYFKVLSGRDGRLIVDVLLRTARDATRASPR